MIISIVNVTNGELARSAPISDSRGDLETLAHRFPDLTRGEVRTAVQRMLQTDAVGVGARLAGAGASRRLLRS